MKKIKIITFCSALCNYGQVLQAYSLQRYLRDNYKEFETKLIYAHPFGATQKPSKKSCVKIFLEHLTMVRRYFNAYILCLDKYDKKIRAIKMEMIKEAMREVLEEAKIGKFDNKRIDMLNKKREFERFKREHIAIHCDDLQDFIKFAPEYEADCYIVGSDQVWNDWGALQRGYTQGVDFYTLEFLPPNHKSKKISYAASLGKAEFNNEFEKAYFKKALAKFDAISVRESCNIKTLGEIGFNAVCVPDPTQLLTKSDYEKLIVSSIKNGEIDSAKSDGKVRKESVFVYMLSNNIAINKDKMMNFLQHSYNIIYTNANMCEFYCLWDYISDFAPTPQEWLVCVRDCKLMITNSFHGCAFAILMNTPFIALSQSGATEKENIRFTNILEIFGLQNRLVDNLADLQAQMNEPIEWDKVNLKLKSWRNIGVEFLEKNLKGL